MIQGASSALEENLVTGSLLLRLFDTFEKDALDECQSIDAKLQLGAYRSRDELHDALTLSLAVFVVECTDNVFLALASEPQWQESEVKDGSLDLRCVLLDDGEFGVDGRQAIIRELISLLDVWFNVCIRTL